MSLIQNYLSPLEFKVSIKRLPHVEFFMQRTEIPGISASPVDVPYPYNRVYQTPDKLSFANLDLTFMIDENMRNYLEIFDWMNGISFPRNFDEYKKINESDDGKVSDITIQILNSHKNLNMEATFINCFPIGLSSVLLDTTQSDVIYPEATATFQYDSYSIKKIG
jgi:hypothetical protein